MILDCQGCHHPYDVSSYKAGQRLRCQCGQIMVVPGDEPKIHVARTLHCSNCGGNLEKGQSNCPFCSALVDLTHARMTAYCSHCLSMSKQGAKFCSDCGKPLIGRIDTPEEATEICPRCNVRLRRRGLGKHKPLECPMCCGLFVAGDVFEQMIRDQEKRVGREAQKGGPKKSALNAEKVTYLKCPRCRDLMNRHNYGRISGVIVDYCKKDGYWLDPGELEKIAKWVASGGLSKKYEIEMQEMKEQKARHSTSAPLQSTPMYGDYSERTAGSGSAMGGSLFDLVSKLFN